MDILLTKVGLFFDKKKEHEYVFYNTYSHSFTVTFYQISENISFSSSENGI